VRKPRARAAFFSLDNGGGIGGDAEQSGGENDDGTPSFMPSWAYGLSTRDEAGITDLRGAKK